MNEFHARFLPHIRSPDRFLRRVASFPPRMRSSEIALFEHELGNGVDFILVCRTHAGRNPKNVPLLFLVRSYYIIFASGSPALIRFQGKEIYRGFARQAARKSRYRLMCSGVHPAFAILPEGHLQNNLLRYLSLRVNLEIRPAGVLMLLHP